MRFVKLIIVIVAIVGALYTTIPVIFTDRSGSETIQLPAFGVDQVVRNGFTNESFYNDSERYNCKTLSEFRCNKYLYVSVDGRDSYVRLCGITSGVKLIYIYHLRNRDYPMESPHISALRSIVKTELHEDKVYIEYGSNGRAVFVLTFVYVFIWVMVGVLAYLFVNKVVDISGIIINAVKESWRIPY